MLPGFQETTAFSGLEAPTAVRFAPDGRIFVAEKPGGIKVFDGVGDTTATTVANLRTERQPQLGPRNAGPRASTPSFPAKPFIYVLYTYDAPIGGTAPTWNDQCPTPPGPTTHGCVSSARLSRLEVSGNQMVGAEQVLIEDWCQQGPTHTIGDLRFGADGALYVSGGDAASPDFVDYGQMGIPTQPVRRPARAASASTQTAPTAEGGALRSQDLRTPARPHHARRHASCAWTPTPARRCRPTRSPASADPDAPADRGLRPAQPVPVRDPARAPTRCGWATWAGTPRRRSTAIANPTDATVENFGWPCYEGSPRQGGYDAANLNLCENLYAAGAARPSPVSSPTRTPARCTPRRPVPDRHVVGLRHGVHAVRAARCPPSSTARSSSPTTRAAASGSWSAAAAALPSPSRIKVFRAGAATPVDIQFGPGGDLFYADVWGGTIRRIHYTAGNQAPRAVASATPTSGATRRSP